MVGKRWEAFAEDGGNGVLGAFGLGANGQLDDLDDWTRSDSGRLVQQSTRMCAFSTRLAEGFPGSW
jgi:hypothetical protein